MSNLSSKHLDSAAMSKILDEIASTGAVPGDGRLESDLHGLLELAETIQDKLDRYSSQLRMMQLLQFITFVIAGTFSMANVARGGSVTITCAYLGVSAVILAFEEFLLIAKIKRRMAHEQRSISEVLGILRETASLVQTSKRLSPIERAHFRIQLSRFGI